MVFQRMKGKYCARLKSSRISGRRAGWSKRRSRALVAGNDWRQMTGVTGGGSMKAWMGAFAGFWTKRGFYVLTAVCLVLVAGAAVYARGRIASPSGEAGRAPAAAAAALATARPEPTPVPMPSATPVPLLWPVSGREILRDYSEAPVWFEPLGLYETHPGVDIEARPAEEVAAVADGTVAFAGFDPQRGYMVEIQSADGLTARYGNLSKDFRVSAGDRVRKGQPLGAVGAFEPSAGAMGPFLHFEAFRDGARVALP
jgi:murein DD-endopeptidase MepM/ murein hydrolase activator NlpD